MQYSRFMNFKPVRPENETKTRTNIHVGHKALLDSPTVRRKFLKIFELFIVRPTHIL